MTNNKKYYWLKLKDDFFTQKAIKKLRKIAGGDTFTIIYLKMMLLAMKNEGKIFHDGIENEFYKELALDLDEDEENVQLTIGYLMKHKLLEVIENEYYLHESVTSTGTESESAERVRKHRENLLINGTKKLQCNNDVTISNDLVTKCNTEIEKEIEKDKEKREKKIKYSESVYLYQDEFDKLIDKYETEERVNKGIDILNNYLQSTGKKYKSHYHVLIGWVLERVDEGAKSKGYGSASYNRQDTDIKKPDFSMYDFRSKNFL